MLDKPIRVVYDMVITNTRPEHTKGASETIKLAFGLPADYQDDDCFTPQNLLEHQKRFPEGQFVAVMRTPDRPDYVVGVAATMRTNYAPTARPRTWKNMLGSLNVEQHTPGGKWLYGVEMAVRPEFRRYGIGSALYEARFDLVRRLGLRGWYAVGMLMGYTAHAHQMSVRDYGEKVMRREIFDPTVTMQMNRGFRPVQVVEDYIAEPDAGNAGVLIVWDNPDFG
ncbi:MAG: GNAT family N-acetyltransferase [Anaerolineae bacterium]|nr:GNAT family N-acetyltransferase [Anaerolineae bacterium]